MRSRAVGKLSICKRDNESSFLGGLCLPLAVNHNSGPFRKVPAPQLRAPVQQKPQWRLTRTIPLKYSGKTTPAEQNLNCIK